MAEERARRLQAQRVAKCEALRQQIKVSQREKEAREREEEDASKRSARLKGEAASLKQQLAAVREENRLARERRHHQFAAVVSSFDAYIKGVTASVD